MLEGSCSGQVKPGQLYRLTDSVPYAWELTDKYTELYVDHGITCMIVLVTTLEEYRRRHPGEDYARGIYYQLLLTDKQGNTRIRWQRFDTDSHFLSYWELMS